MKRIIESLIGLLKQICGFVMFLFVGFCLAQTTSKNTLETIVIVGKSEKDVTGLNVSEIDSTLISTNSSKSFTELIRKLGAGQIRSYGPNGIASPSFRGTSGNQTAVLWNGININSLTTGEIDFSLIPVMSSNEVIIQKGGSSSLFGSGAIGGTIQLNNTLSFNNEIKATYKTEVGSFNNIFNNYSVNYSTKKIIFSTSIFNRDLKNNYSYINTYNTPEQEETRINSSINYSGIYNQLVYKINKHHVIGAKYWYQDNYSQVANNINANQNSTAHQVDYTNRALAHWDYNKAKTTLNFKTAFLSHYIKYTNPQISLVSNINSYVFANSLELKHKYSNLITFNSGINYRYEYTGEENYGQKPTRRNASVFTGVKYSSYNKKLVSILNIRQPIVDGSLEPISPSLGTEYKLTSNISLTNNLSRNYRLPTFNDLYWNGAGGLGNPNLLPELSIGGDLGLKTNFNINKSFSINFNTTGFSQHVDNWITWQAIGGLSQPKNIKQVWTRGLENLLSFNLKLKEFVIENTTTYNYTKTTSNKVYSEKNKNQLDNQLIYVPLHEFNNINSLKYKNLELQTRVNYVGKQYSDLDNKERFTLDPYTVFGSTLNYNIKLGNTLFTSYLDVDNIFNTTYENRRGYPMYGRNFNLGIQISLNHKINKQ